MENICVADVEGKSGKRAGTEPGLETKFLKSKNQATLYKGLQGQIGLGTFRKDTQDEVQGPRGQVARC